MSKIIKTALSVLLTLVTMSPQSVVAFRNFASAADKAIETVIAAGELNRIHIRNGEIMEVIGDESKYSLYWSGDWRNLFIRPKVEPGEIISLSLIFAGGRAQDVRFTVGDTAAQTICINVGNSGIAAAGDCVTGMAGQNLKAEISAMMRAMIGGVKGKYYRFSSKRTLQKTEKWLITQRLGYRYKDLSGAVLMVKGLGSQPVSLREEDFKGLFKGTIAIHLGSSLLQPGAVVDVFIITRESYAR
jgi:hypothetical protein